MRRKFNGLSSRDLKVYRITTLSFYRITTLRQIFDHFVARFLSRFFMAFFIVLFCGLYSCSAGKDVSYPVLVLLDCRHV
jgi:hypothetical protein